jgi:parvulin-like peptidyl-prolyl isomerase
MNVLREPLLHFAVVGAILFAGYSSLGDGGVGASAVEPVSIGEGDLRWLKEGWSKQWQREPSADELKSLVADLLEEKLLAREAEEMGLDRDDTIIRRRLAQKLKFLVEDTAQLAQPTDEDLQRFHAANASRFETSGKISFSQVYFNPERRPDAEADARAALAELRSGRDSAEVGDGLMLGDGFAEINGLGVSSMFGAEFAHEIFALGAGQWQGPVKSGYGFHLLLVTERTLPETRPFNEVRDAVLTEWRNESQKRITRDYLAELRKKYGVETDYSAKAALEAGAAAQVAAK